MLSIPFGFPYAPLAPFKHDSTPPRPVSTRRLFWGALRRPLAARGAGAGHAATPCLPMSVPAPPESALTGDASAAVVKASRVVVVTADAGSAVKRWTFLRETNQGTFRRAYSLLRTFQYHPKFAQFQPENINRRSDIRPKREWAFLITRPLNARFLSVRSEFCVFKKTVPFKYFGRALRDFASSLEMPDLIREMTDLIR